MNKDTRLANLLRRIGAIRRMERGSLSENTRSSSRGRYVFYSHNTWENGKSVTRYVPREKLEEMQSLIDAHREFERLVKQYEDLIVRRTRAELKRRTERRSAKKSPGQDFHRAS